MTLDPTDTRRPTSAIALAFEAVAPLRIDPANFSSASVQSIVLAAKDELDRRYGPATDPTSLKAADFTPPLGEFLLARVDDHLAGGVGLRTVAPDIAEIKRLWVRPDLRRSGIGAALMTRAVADARVFGARLVMLETGPLQPEAVALYVSQGWRRVDRLPVGEHGHPESIRFTLELDPTT